MGYWALLDISNLILLGCCNFRKSFMGPFVITTYTSGVAYQLDLVGQFFHICPWYHVILLCRFVPIRDRIDPPEPIEVEDT